MKRTTEFVYRGYLSLLLLIAGYLLWSTWPSFSASQKELPTLFLLFLLGLLLGQKLVPINPARNIWLSLSDFIAYTVLFAFSFPVCIWFTAILWSCLYLLFIFFGTVKSGPVRIFPIAAQFTISFGAGSFLFHTITSGNPGQDLMTLLAVFLTWIVVTGIQLLNMAIDRGLKLKLNFVTVLRMLPEALQYEDLISTFLGALLAVLLVHAPAVSLLLAFPVFIFALSNEANVRTAGEFSKLMEVLLKTMESSDPSGYSHSQRVAVYAKELASKLGLRPEQAKEIYEMGLIHDLGMLAVPDQILFKPERLSVQERAIIERHPAQTSSFLQGFHHFSRNLKTIEAHHERYDGLGYPAGIKGEEIPLAARIVAVADAYDAMTNDKPFRRRLEKRVALRRIWRGRGTQFDPGVVEALFDYLEEERPQRIEDESALWVVAQAIGLEAGLSAGELDDLRDAVILHELNPPVDIFAKPGDSSSVWWQVDYREHIGVTEMMRRDVPTGEEVIKILWSHHEWTAGENQRENPLIPIEARILAISEAFVSCLAAGIHWLEAMLRVKERAGTQFDPMLVNHLENLLAQGKIPYEILMGAPELSRLITKSG